MSYSVDFLGSFYLDRPLSAAQAGYLHAFSKTRRFARDEKLTVSLEDPLRVGAGIETVGKDGGYYVGDAGDSRYSLQNYTMTPAGQPWAWCPWRPTGDNQGIVGPEEEGRWDEAPAWVGYLIKHFLGPWGYILCGSVDWQGAIPADFGRIRVINSQVYLLRGKRCLVDAQGREWPL